MASGFIDEEMNYIIIVGIVAYKAESDFQDIALMQENLNEEEDEKILE